MVAQPPQAQVRRRTTSIAPPLDLRVERTPWHIKSPSFPATAPGQSWQRRPAACSRPPASSSSGTSIPPARTSTTRRARPFPDRTLDSIKRTGVGIKGPTTTPVGSGFRSVNVLLRKELDLYACIRPCKAYEGVRTRFPDTDIVIVRENTEDLYAGIEFEKDTDEDASSREFLPRSSTTRVREDAGISIKPISVFGSERIVASAFDYAKDNGRKKVTAAHKANIMKFSDGLFLEVARKVAEDTRTSSSRTASSTTCATSSCRARRSTT